MASSSVLSSVLVLAVALAVSVPAEATFHGEGTYYGTNGWAGACAGQLPPLGRTWPPPGGAQGAIGIALNRPQYSTNMCGKKIMYRGKGKGLGGRPIAGFWQKGIITNECPECKYGDIDLGDNGDGRWEVEWYFVDSFGGNTVENRSVVRARNPKRTHSPKYWYRMWLRLQKKRRAAKGRKLLTLTSV